MLGPYLETFRDEMEIVTREVAPNEVSPYLKTTKPVLFERFCGARAVGNLWATRERIARALGTSSGGLTDALERAIDNPCPTNAVSSSSTHLRSARKADLRTLPLPLYYKNDGGRYLTSGVVCAEWEGKKNMSFHRMMLVDETHFAARLVERHLYAMHKSALSRGEELRVAICIGVCPTLLLAASVSTSYGVSELEIASSLRKSSLGEPVTTTVLDGVEVPAHAEYVLVGRLTAATAPEGPFVDITGTYDIVREQPRVEIEKIYVAESPIMHLLLPGGYEHYLLMGLPREPTIRKSVSQVVPRVAGVRLTEGGCCWLHGVVSIKKQREGDGKNAIMAAFTGHPSMKRVVVVDDDVDIFDDERVEWALATRFQADRDTVTIPGARGSSLDPSSDGLTCKVGFDATKKKDDASFARVAE